MVIVIEQSKPTKLPTILTVGLCCLCSDLCICVKKGTAFAAYSRDAIVAGDTVLNRSRRSLRQDALPVPPQDRNTMASNFVGDHQRGFAHNNNGGEIPRVSLTQTRLVVRSNCVTEIWVSVCW